MDIKRPMPTPPTGPATDARMSPEKGGGSLYLSTSGHLLVSVEAFLACDVREPSVSGDDDTIGAGDGALASLLPQRLGLVPITV